MSNVGGGEGSFSSQESHRHLDNRKLKKVPVRRGPTSTNSSGASASHQQQPAKKKRNSPGTPDPKAEVVALSPKTLMAKNRFVCEICSKGFPRDQNLQLHKRGHNLPWKLRQRTANEVKRRVFICPEPTCVHHDPSRALGDLTGIKKHFSRKHGEKKWNCGRCSKKYAVQSDWKAHRKTCGTREYKCDCGAVFSRRDSFITHRAFCDALTRENSKLRQGILGPTGQDLEAQMAVLMHISTNSSTYMGLTPINDPAKSVQQELIHTPFRPIHMEGLLPATSSSSALFGSSPKGLPSSTSGLQRNANFGPSTYDKLDQIFGPSNIAATALLQKATHMGATASNTINSPTMPRTSVSSMVGPDMVSGPRPTSNMHTFDKFQSPNEQSPLFGGGFLLKNAEDTAARLFEIGEPSGHH